MREPQDNSPHRKRCKRFNVPGHAHFLTFSCFRRRPFLNRDRSRNWLLDAISLARKTHAFDLWAFVIMPEHAHVVLKPRNATYSISAILKTIKQSVSNRAIAYVRQHTPEFLVHMTDLQPNGKQCFRFWQRGGGYDRNLTTVDTIWEKINYIHNNPVERRLCARAEDWIWSSAADFSGTRAGPIDLDLESLPRI